jgi:two-component system cell cycle sensor histidine kinase/response regulator CckA
MQNTILKLLQFLQNRLERKRPGELLSSNQLHSVLKGAALGFYDWHVPSGEFRVDEHWLAILGYEPGELYVDASVIPTLVEPSDREFVKQRLFDAITSDDPFTIDFRGVHKQGRLCWVRSTGSVIQRDAKTGAPLRVCGAMQDISSIKQGERERDEFMQFFEMSSDLMMIAKLDGKFVKVNKATLDTLGFSEEEIYSIDIMDLAHPDDVAGTTEEFHRQMQSGVTLSFENRIRRKDGSYRWLSYRSAFSHELGLSYATARDVTESKRIQEALRQQQERYNALVDNTADVIMEFDRQHRHTYVNNAVTKAIGLTPEDFMGKTHEEMGFPHDLCVLWEDAIERVFVSGQSYSTYFEADNPGGRMRVDWSVFPGLVIDGEVKTVLNVSRDITQYMRMEEDLRRMQKLSSLGVLAGGIAHDFNNILTILFGNLSLAKGYVEPDHKSYQALDKAEVAFQRATHLTSQLLTFAKGGEPVKQDVSIAALIEEVVKFDLSGSNVKQVFSAPADLWHASVDKGQISQVFSNLATNANQAMPEGGHLYISIDNSVLGRNEVMGLEAGNYLKFIVRDEGIGIPEEHLDKIFDPYFTTKEKGSGLGLATVHSIITRHEGHISVESTVGKGTTLLLYLPAASSTQQEQASSLAPATGPVKQQARVLVMDDEAMICQLCSSYLTAQGYLVDVAHDGHEAIRKYDAAMLAGTPYDCLVMDLTIPGGMSGKEAITEIRKRDPNVRAIVSSGYAADPVMANFREHGFSGFIPKPFQLNALHQEIKRVLAET